VNSFVCVCVCARAPLRSLSDKTLVLSQSYVFKNLGYNGRNRSVRVYGLTKNIIVRIILFEILAHKTLIFICNGRYFEKNTRFSTRNFVAKETQSGIYLCLIYYMNIKKR
jgi:hypothetical protein